MDIKQHIDGVCGFCCHGCLQIKLQHYTIYFIFFDLSAHLHR